MADYIVSEEVLRQVLDALDDNMQDERVGQWAQMSRAVGAISEILASPPAEPRAWAHKTNTSAVLRSVGGTMETDMWEPLYRKDCDD